MKFQLAINMERIAPDTDMADVERHTLEMVQMADAGGFHIVWAAEHHALEMTIAPNPFQILTWWAAHATASVLAQRWSWRPTGIRSMLRAKLRCWICIAMAGWNSESARAPISGSSTECTPDSSRPTHGATCRRCCRLSKRSGRVTTLMRVTIGPFRKPPPCLSLCKPHPPIWVAARAPITYDYAVKNQCNIMSWPLTRPIVSRNLPLERLQTALDENPGQARPIFSAMQHTCVYDNKDDWMVPIEAARRQLAQFENLFKNAGGCRKWISRDD